MKNSLLKIFPLKIFFFAVLIFLSSKAIAFSPEEHLPDPEEKRAQALFLEVRCPVCAGQVIESSDSEISYQLRKLIRTKVSEGKSDAEIKSYLIHEFGDDIITSPPINLSTIFLWLLPIGITGLGVVMLFKFMRNKPVK